MSTKYDTGKHQWTFGTPCDYRNGEPMRKLLGPCPACGMITSEYGGGFSCNADYCQNSSNMFVCSTADKWPEWWNTDIQVKRDGSAWMAFREGFVNLDESTAGFGNTPAEAVADFMESESPKEDSSVCHACGGTGVIHS